MAERGLEMHFAVQATMTIAMTPAEFMTEIVLPTVTEFRRDPRPRRRAYLAASRLFSEGRPPDVGREWS